MPKFNIHVTAIAHDYFTQHGGAERVAAQLIDHFKPPRVITAAYDAPETFTFEHRVPVETSFIQHIRPLRRDPRRALFLLPLAWRLTRPAKDGVLLCSSSGWAHGAQKGAASLKVVYCHNPARWLYQPEDFFQNRHRILRELMKFAAPALRSWDQRAAHSADLYISNSRAVAERVQKVYGIQSSVVHPPVGLSPDGPRESMTGIPSHYFITVGRSRGYKNTTNLIDAFRDRPHLNLVCVGTQPQAVTPPSNVTFTGKVSDAQLRELYSSASALISVAREDFGLTPIEANSQGTPALVLRAGGFLDSVIEGQSGLFIDGDSPQQIAHAIDNFPHTWDKDFLKRHAGKFSTSVFANQILDVIERHLAHSSQSVK